MNYSYTPSKHLVGASLPKPIKTNPGRIRRALAYTLVLMLLATAALALYQPPTRVAACGAKTFTSI